MKAAASLVLGLAMASSLGACDAPQQPSGAPTAVPSIVEAKLDPLALPHDAWGFTAVDRAHAYDAAASLPLEVAAGRVIVAAWDSPDAAGAAALVSSEHLAGVIVMGGAASDASQVRALTGAVADAASADGLTYPAVISVDQEGGPVARLRGFVPDLPAFMAAGANPDKHAVRDAYAQLGIALADLGFTVDWAPVADVTVGQADPAIGVRSAGSDPSNVSATVLAASKGLQDAGVLAAVKHFPGHGSVTADSHQALPVQHASLEELASRDLLPFHDAVSSGIPFVMVGHIAVDAWGAGPASLNPAAYAYLRDTMGFTGVAVTDALNMGAIPEASPGANAVAALAAGADLLLLPADPAAARAAIVAAVNSGALDRERLNDAIARIGLAMTYQRRLADQAPPVVSQPESAQNFAASSAVVSAPECSAPLIGTSVTITGGLPAERDALANALAARGVSSGGGTSIRLLGSSGGTATADVVVALDAPWGLAASQAPVKIGLFGRSDDALAGLADVLTGRVKPQGLWPVGGMPVACG